MRKLILFLVFCAIGSALRAQTMPLPKLSELTGGVQVTSTSPEESCVYTWYILPEDSSIIAEGRLCDDRSSGWWQYNHLSGECQRMQGRFDGGLRSGLWQCFDQDNELRKEGEFVRGKASGFWQMWGDNGVLAASGWCADGAKNGWWKEYLSHNSYQDGEYAGNQKIGVWKRYVEGSFVSVKDWGE